MAQRIHIVLEDDIDGGEAVETVLFGLDGVGYEIDLSDKNASKLRDVMAKYIAASRRSGLLRPTGGRASYHVRVRSAPHKSGSGRSARGTAFPTVGASPPTYEPPTTRRTSTPG